MRRAKIGRAEYILIGWLVSSLVKEGLALLEGCELMTLIFYVATFIRETCVWLFLNVHLWKSELFVNKIFTVKCTVRLGHFFIFLFGLTVEFNILSNVKDN